ncbi:hypothetical protein PIIN_07559 [Serendipita indica DSM 11827]|uniref:Uncharacterized protein n=1 Tax=Serendipita indica (strain DSM 11827) TaxID=1109443 RepID=G4TQL3_SERID|nr:hypothetical protein PIIN_07559 [Serendipita indica DSM 11827]
MSTFTPVNTFEGSEKDWPMKLGMLDWDDTRIVFTKRELINFLKYTGTSVDPNFNNISKLPRYAAFGKLDGSADATNDGRGGASAASGTGAGSDFVPTRRVREAPGGKSNISFVDESEDALAAAPPPKVATRTEDPVGLPDNNAVPSRRVRDPPGGKDSLKNFWDAAPEDEFVPTRRVRERPGGQDSINDIF